MAILLRQIGLAVQVLWLTTPAQRVHFAAQLNDNGDGTFSIRGIYQSKPSFRQQNGKTVLKAPPIVISKEPLSGNSPPPKPELPVYLAPKFSLGGAGARKVAQLQEKTPNEQARSWTGDSTRGDLRTRGAPSRAEEMEVDDSEGSKAADALGNSRRLRAARRPEAKTQASSSRQPLPSSLISPGTFHPGDLLEMEDWEVAPGRIRESAAADSGRKLYPPLTPFTKA
jgi:hypothetical protein